MYRRLRAEAPGTADHVGSGPAGVQPQRFYIVDEVRGCVVLRIGRGRAPAAPALIVEEHVVPVGIEQLFVCVVEACTRAAMQEDDRNTRGIAPVLPVDTVAGTNIEPSSVIYLVCHRPI